MNTLNTFINYEVERRECTPGELENINGKIISIDHWKVFIANLNSLLSAGLPEISKDNIIKKETRDAIIDKVIEKSEERVILS